MPLAARRHGLLHRRRLVDHPGRLRPRRLLARLCRTRRHGRHRPPRFGRQLRAAVATARATAAAPLRSGEQLRADRQRGQQRRRVPHGHERRRAAPPRRRFTHKHGAVPVGRRARRSRRVGARERDRPFGLGRSGHQRRRHALRAGKRQRRRGAHLRVADWRQPLAAAHDHQLRWQLSKLLGPVHLHERRRPDRGRLRHGKRVQPRPRRGVGRRRRDGHLVVAARQRHPGRCHGKPRGVPRHAPERRRAARRLWRTVHRCKLPCGTRVRLRCAIQHLEREGRHLQDTRKPKRLDAAAAERRRRAPRVCDHVRNHRGRAGDRL